MAPNEEGSDWGTNRKLTMISTPCAGYRTDKAPAEAETTVSPNCASSLQKNHNTPVLRDVVLSIFKTNIAISETSKSEITDDRSSA